MRSKGLKALKKIASITKFDGGVNCSLGDKVKFKIIEKELKVLAIIKKKEVNVVLEILGIYSYESYEHYWKNNEYDNCCKLTQEEFDLLKEVLESE